MAQVPITGLTALGNGRWTVDWDNSTDPVDVWMQGLLLTEGSLENTLDVTWTGRGGPPVEVVDAGDLLPSMRLLERVRVQWRTLAAAGKYIVSYRVNAGSWFSETPVVTADTGYMTWTSPVFADGDVVEVTVTPYFGAEAGTPIEHTQTVRCLPVAPKITATYNKEDEEIVVDVAPASLWEGGL
jgi:hypothetical protein